MFKRMKLAKKIGLGFGALVVLSAIAAGVAWYGLKGLESISALDRQATRAVEPAGVMRGTNAAAFEGLEHAFAVPHHEKP